MLEYVKLILFKVSFDKHLFEKELLKGLKAIIKEEVEELKTWCYINFGLDYQNILNNTFQV
jgi:hypothetical protein